MDVGIMNKTEAEKLREQVRQRYGESALRVQSGTGSGCCGSSAESGCCTGSDDPISSDLYTALQANEVPSEALMASLGCGNPTALAKLNPGEKVLDLGSGGGIDVFLSAKRVGPTGFAYGLDMTDEMLALAEENKKKAGIENVQFLKGYIEEVPLPDNSVDVAISNCVINLAADKRPVLREAFRVLKPGGRFAVSDIVRRGDAPEAILRSMEAWTGCIAGALHQDVYKALLSEVGFTDVGIEFTRSYTADNIAGEAAEEVNTVDTIADGACCTPAGLTGVISRWLMGCSRAHLFGRSSRWSRSERFASCHYNTRRPLKKEPPSRVPGCKDALPFGRASTIGVQWRGNSNCLPPNLSIPNWPSTKNRPRYDFFGRHSCYTKRTITSHLTPSKRCLPSNYIHSISLAGAAEHWTSRCCGRLRFAFPCMAHQQSACGRYR